MWIDLEGLEGPSQETRPLPTPVHVLNEDQSDTVASVSTAFTPDRIHQGRAADSTVISGDRVFFYVHSDILQQDDPTALVLTSGVPSSRLFEVADDSVVVNIILHILYDLNISLYAPPFDSTVTAVARLKAWGFFTHNRITPGRHIYTHLLSIAPLNPLALYTLAAEHQIHELVVACSPHLLSLDLSTVTDEIGMRIGPQYLLRLFMLHYKRSEALRQLLFKTPRMHAAIPGCDPESNGRIRREWGMAAASLIWQLRPDIPAAILRANLRPVILTTACLLCKEGLAQAIDQLIVAWSNVPSTI